MTSVICHVALAAWVASVSGCANSHSADLPSPLERSEPHEALAFYEGTWTILDKEHEGYRETCSWLGEVRRHIVCRARVQSADGPREWIFNQHHTRRVVRDRRYKLYSTGELYDAEKDPDETRNLAVELPEVRGRLAAVLESLPPDAALPFPFRSISAFKFRAAGRLK